MLGDGLCSAFYRLALSLDSGKGSLKGRALAQAEFVLDWIPIAATFLERYEIVRQLGQGGMGVVYEVFDKSLLFRFGVSGVFSRCVFVACAAHAALWRRGHATGTLHINGQ
jgi:hypothetical protein